MEWEQEAYEQECYFNEVEAAHLRSEKKEKVKAMSEKTKDLGGGLRVRSHVLEVSKSRKKKPGGTYRVTGYPRYFSIDTPDGEGEAIKDGIEDPWLIAVPTGDWKFYGAAESAQQYIRAQLKDTYPKRIGRGKGLEVVNVSFGEVERYKPAVEE